jgi:recombination protein RecA
MAARKAAQESAETAVPEDTESRVAKVLASEIVSKIQKKWGGTALLRASDDRHQRVSRIPSGIFMLDYALGGGWQAGRIHVVFGHKSSAKTTSLLKTVASAQRMCMNCYTFRNEEGYCVCKSYKEAVCAYLDVEGTWDHKWANALGIQTDKLLYSRPDYGEQTLDIAESLIRSGEIDMLCIDSLAFLTPAKEIEESVEKETMGVQPRLIGKGIRKFNAALSAVKNEMNRTPTIFFTNQMRMKLGVMFGNPETQPGGMAPGFAATTEVKCWAGKYEMDDNSARPLSVDMNFRVEKNKSGPAKMEGNYRIILSDTEVKKMGDVYDEDAILNLAQKYSIIEGHGNSWTCFGEKFGGKSIIEKRMLTEPAFKRKLADTLMAVLLAA